MRKKLLAGLATGVFMFGMAVMAHASLTTIGTATYNGSDYKLIWDDDNNGNSVIWLDYTHAATFWSAQKTWTAGLDSSLTYNIDAGYTVDWEAAWRLPSTVVDGDSWGYDGTTSRGYNITSSEMGHLFYEELGNVGLLDTLGKVQSAYGLINTGNFNNLIASWYWSGTEYTTDPIRAWGFDMTDGCQQIYYKSNNGYGLAIRSGQVSVVPIPGAVWLLGAGLTGLVGIRGRMLHCNARIKSFLHLTR